MGDPAPETKLPKSQEWLIEFFNLLGYTPQDGDYKLGIAPYAGLCYGVGHMAVPAILLGELPVFKERFYRIFEILKKFKNQNKITFTLDEDSYLHLLFPNGHYSNELRTNSMRIFNEIMEQAYDKTSINTPWAEKLRDIHSFCDGVVFYQFPWVQLNLLGELKLWDIIPLLTPEKLVKLGGITKPIEDSRALYSEVSLMGYFQRLRKTLVSPPFFDAPLALTLISHKSTADFETEPNHAVTISFHEGKWQIVDANDLELIGTETEDDAQIAKMVITALGGNVDLDFWGVIDMSTEVYVAGIYQDLLTSRLKNWANTSLMDYMSFFLPEPVLIKSGNILEGGATFVTTGDEESPNLKLEEGDPLQTSVQNLYTEVQTIESVILKEIEEEFRSLDNSNLIYNQSLTEIAPEIERIDQFLNLSFFSNLNTNDGGKKEITDVLLTDIEAMNSGNDISDREENNGNGGSRKRKQKDRSVSYSSNKKNSSDTRHRIFYSSNNEEETDVSPTDFELGFF